MFVLWWSWSLIETVIYIYIYIYDDLSIGVLACRVVVTRIWTMTMTDWHWWQLFSLHLCMSQSCRLNKWWTPWFVCFPEWCIIECRLPKYCDPQINMNPSFIMIHGVWFRLIMDITIVWYHILPVVLLINTELCYAICVIISMSKCIPITIKICTNIPHYNTSESFLTWRFILFLFLLIFVYYGT